MPIDPITATVSAGGNLADNIVAQIFAKRNIKNQLSANKELAKYTNQMNIENWKMQNAYNTPAAQMQRYKDAKLNPNLIYGQGNPGNASGIHDYSQPQTDVSLPTPKIAGPMLETYQNIRQQNADIDNTKQATQNAVTNQAKDLLLLEYEKRFGAERRLWENANLAQSFKLGNQKWNIGEEDLRQQIMKTNQTALLLPYQNIALQTEYQLKARAMEKYNLDISLLNQQREEIKARIELMNVEKQAKKMGLPGIQWENMLKSQSYEQKRQLFPTEMEKQKKELKWLPWKAGASVVGSGIGAAVGAGIGVSKLFGGKKGGPKSGNFRYYR